MRIEDRKYDNWIGGAMEDYIKIYREHGEKAAAKAILADKCNDGIDDEGVVNECIGYIIQNQKRS